MGRLLTTAALLASLALSSCSDDGEATTPTPTPSPTSTSPSADPTPTPPAMPDAARAHTPEGAEAFVRYFWEVVDYSSQTLETDYLDALSRDDCQGCLGGIRALNDVRKQNGRIEGGESTLSGIKATGFEAGGQVIYDVTFQHTNAPEFTDYPGSNRDIHREAATKPTEMRLFAIPGGWEVAELGLEQ